MKCFLALLLLVATPILSAFAQSAGPDDQYLVIYSLMQQADMSNNNGQPRQALNQYLQVQADLQRFNRIFPDWNPRIVNFRLKYLADRIAEVTEKLPVATNPVPETATAAAVATSPAATSAVANLQAQLNALHDQVRTLQADNSTLQSKLREALGVQPDSIDPRELTKAQEIIRSLMKENDLLKATRSQGGPAPAAGPAAGSAESDALRQAQAALAEANRKLADQTARADQLARENQALQSRVQSLLASPDAIEALREENALLKKQIADLKTAPAATNDAARLNAQLADMQKQLASLQSSVQVAALEKSALENRVRQMQITAVTAASGPGAGPSEAEARIRALTLERDDLLGKLGEANRALYGSRKQNAAARINQLTDEVNALRARLAVDEAAVIPYTPEELALFKSSAPAPATAATEKKSITELPAGSAQLVAEAQHYFSAGQYDKAEDDYQKILQHDQNNGLVLANLATIEMEQGKLPDADKHIQEAVSQSPNDAYNLSVLGYLKFQEGKYDEALDVLSRAVKLDPRNPEIENYLGVTLGHKGLRRQAETALRKAIQLDPDYGAAHNNLAVIYISEKPPLVELARWHYQKALDLGQPRNPELEQMLDAKGAP